MNIQDQIMSFKMNIFEKDIGTKIEKTDFKIQ